MHHQSRDPILLQSLYSPPKLYDLCQSSLVNSVSLDITYSMLILYQLTPSNLRYEAYTIA
jgi:hypothetical protein